MMNSSRPKESDHGFCAPSPKAAWSECEKCSGNDAVVQVTASRIFRRMALGIIGFGIPNLSLARNGKKTHKKLHGVDYS